MEWNDIKYKQTAEDIQEVTSELRDLLINKNESYGDSALNPKRIFSRAELLEQLNVRLDDKLSRLAFGRDDLIPEDVELDILGYLVLRRIARKRARLAEGAEEQPPSRKYIEPCDAAPKGWVCSRHKGHEGPCAASPIGSVGVPKPWERTLKPESTRESFGEHH